MNAEKIPDFSLNEKSKVLVIDDDESIRYLLRFLLEKHQHQVYEAEDGEQGLEKYKEIEPDIVITDLVMPKKEGISVIKELKTSNTHLPVIAITSDVHGRARELLELSKQVGATTVLQKPITTQNLSNALFEAEQLMG